MAAEEMVLVVKREVIEELGMFHGLEFNIQPYLDRLFAPNTLTFMPRSKAETNPDYKQLIPYVLMETEGKYLSYVRGKRAGEKRLVGNRSMGIGGHINPIDDEIPLFGTDYKEVYETAVQREIEEEVNVQANATDRIVALLNDDTNEVGKVHLGVVHLWTLDSEDVTRKEQMITQMGFSAVDELTEMRDNMETWSQLCFDAIADGRL
jgi:predicted NUDIX family phosphoesterase